MEERKQIFLYTRSAKIPSGHLKALRDAGILPVQVESLDLARLVDAQPLVSGDAMLSAALRAIAAHSCTGQAKNFVNLLVEGLIGPPRVSRE